MLPERPSSKRGEKTSISPDWNDSRIHCGPPDEQFFGAVVREARRLELLSDEHFSVDGALIEARASMKSYREKGGGGPGPDAGGDRDVLGERRRNDTREHHGP